MTPKNPLEIISDIENHLKKVIGKKYYSDFYIWITNNIESRLFWDHNVSRTNHRYIYRKALNEDYAREVEKLFLQKWMEWWSWWWLGDWSAVYVYCYEITDSTEQ